MTTFAERLKEERKRAGLSQTELARKAGCGQSLIGNLEAGAQKSTAKLPQIAAALGINALYLAERKGPRTNAEADRMFTGHLDNQYLTPVEVLAKRITNGNLADVDIEWLNRALDLVEAATRRKRPQRDLRHSRGSLHAAADDKARKAK